MRKNILYIAIACLLLAISLQTTAQTNTGTLNGKVKDSTYNFVLSSATVAVYKNIDSALLQFCIPNNFGEFSLLQLPFGDTLKMQITHTGYTTYERRLILDSAHNPLDLGWVYMHQHGKSEDEVMVTAIVPVRMNGDTLEFNPRAFKMDVNATAEDLMRRLPGFTIWGDGEITFNGKKITALYVDGKPFLGGTDVTAATQNLPKDALDKIQVYQQRNDKNPLDSVLLANLKLKEDKKVGHFGKAGAGYGTNNRYAADAMLTGFNKKMQTSVVGAANNINKVAGNVDALIKNSSFKGEGNNITYQPDFTMAGLNKPVTIGAKFQYDFIPEVQYQKSERLNADYFLNSNNNLINRNTTTRTLLRPDSVLTRRSVNTNTNIYTNQDFNSHYAKTTEAYSFNIGANGSINNNHTTGTSVDEQERTGDGIISTGTSYSENKNLGKNAAFSAGFTKNPVQDYYSDNEKYRRPFGFTVRYSFGINGNEGSGVRKSLLTYTNNPAARKEYDRLYAQRNSLQLSHTIDVQYPYLRQLIFGRKRLGEIDMKLGGTFRLHDNNYETDVKDLDTATRVYETNTYLTNDRHENIINLQPELIFSKRFYKGLTNRYSKSVSVDFTTRMQHYAFTHSALQTIQNFSYHYNYLTPQASFEYFNHQYGSYEARYNFNFETRVDYPGISQIAPLVDSTNLWYIPKGNADLKPQYVNKCGLSYNLQSRKPKNPYSIVVNGDLATVKDRFTDSSFYDKANRNIVYPVNMDGYEHWHGGVRFRKSYSPDKNHTFEWSSGYNIDKYIIPEYINSLLSIAKSISHAVDGSLNYSHKDIVALRFEERIALYNARQNGITSFTNKNEYTRVSGMVQFPKNLTWNSNITYNKSISNKRDALHYTIWNASVTYRFLKGNQGEVKFSALDLLHQNKSVINTGSGNTQTFGYSNVLQQYFMLSLAYYPRQSGKRAK